MSLENYINKLNIISSTRPVDAVQLRAEDRDVINHETVEITNFDDPALDEVIELHVYDTIGSYVTSDHISDHWKHFANEDSFVQYDIYKNLTDLGITQGSFKFVLNFHRTLVGDSNNSNLFIKEISPDRSEILVKIGDDHIKSAEKDTSNTKALELTTHDQLSLFEKRRPELCNDDGFIHLMFLNLGNNRLIQFVNYKYLFEMEELYIKLYQPLPDFIKEKQKFWIVQQIRQPYSDNVVLYRQPVQAPTNNLRGPNFEIETKYTKINETNFASWNDLLGSSVATSQQIVDRIFSGSLQGADLGIDYSGFQNFVNFSSAAERLKNFKYKVELIEYYNDQITTLNSVSESNEVNANKSVYRKYKDTVIGNFDGFERYLYKEQSGSFYTHGVTGSAIFNETFTVEPWPKIEYRITGSADGLHPGAQYQLHHSTSSIAENYYNGLLASASLWDVHNNAALAKAIPEHIREDENNDEFETFVHMIGQHYDIIWTYIKHQTDLYNRDEHFAHGMSKNLLYDVAESFGWHLVNGNQSERLFEYLLGTNELGEFGKINERKIDKDLVLYVPFDEGRPDFARKNFVDYSPRQDQLFDFDKPSFVTGYHGHGAKFDGNNYLRYNTPYDYGTENYAISFWIKDFDAHGISTIFSATSGSSGIIDTGIDIGSILGELVFRQHYTGSHGLHSVTLPTSIVNKFSSSYLDSSSPQGQSTGGESNGWHHIVFNVDRQESASVYVNGEFQDGEDVSISASADIGPESTGDFPRPVIGALAPTGDDAPINRLTGSLDEFRIYKRKLSLDEISELYTDGGLYVTQSSAVTLATPKEDLTTQVWRRIVNNLPHLLKTKGTSRSVKALLACYGIPESLLSIREYGGPKTVETTPAAIEDRFSYALQFDSGSTGRSQLKIVRDHYFSQLGDWGVSPSQNTTLNAAPDAITASMSERPPDTIEFRIKPAITASMYILSHRAKLNTNNMHWALGIQHTGSYSGSTQYGRLFFQYRDLGAGTPDAVFDERLGNANTSYSDYVPLYDGEFWNVRLFTAFPFITSSHVPGDNFVPDITFQTQKASDYISGKIIHMASGSLNPGSGSNVANSDSLVKYWATGTQNKELVLGGATGSGLFGAAGVIAGTFSGSIQEYREWLEILDQDAFDKHTLNPKSYVSVLSPSGSYDTLVRHYPLGTNQIAYDHSKTLFITSSHPNQDIQDFSDPQGDDATAHASMSGWTTPTDTVNNDHYERVDETYYIHGPSIGGKNLKSEKIRLEDNRLVHPLSRETRGEVSQFDRVSNDSNRLGIYFSPQDMINKDIYNQIGSVALDDFFGSAEDQYKDEYPRFKRFAYDYWKKYENDNDINAYIRIFALFDFSFFQQVKQLIPVRTNADTGLIIEPSVLERSKVMVEAEPSREELHYEDFIPDPFPDPIMEPLHYTASITDPVENIIGEPMHYTASITDPGPSLNAEPMHFTASVENKVMELSAESLFLTGSVDGKVGRLTPEFFPVHKLATSSVTRNDVTDPGLDLFGIASGYKGAEYNHVSVFYSSIHGWTTQSRSPLQNSPTASIITEQRKSPTHKKKVFHYAPQDDVDRFYPLNKFVGSKILDMSPGERLHSKNLVHIPQGKQTNFVVTASASDFTFETITHNRFTGEALVFSASISESVAKRGNQFVKIPRFTGERLGQWAISFVMKASKTLTGGNTGKLPSATTQSILIGSDLNNDGEEPTSGAADSSLRPGIWWSDNKIRPRDDSGTYWTFTNAAKIPHPTEVNHFVLNWNGNDPLYPGTGSFELYVNGELIETQRRGIVDATATNDLKSGSFFFEALGGGYYSDTNTHQFSGSLSNVRFYDKNLDTQEVSYLNRYPHLRANRDIEPLHGRGRTIMTRARRSNGFAPFTDIGLVATSHSLVASDYREDGFDSSFYEGSKLTAPDINSPSENDVDGEEIIKITERNRFNLIYRKDLPDGANLDVR